jgi:tetratricopeptide (TPR) repeat protein
MRANQPAVRTKQGVVTATMSKQAGTSGALRASVLLCLISAASLLWGSGCGGRVSSGAAGEEHNQYVQRARRLQELRDYAGAAAQYDRALQVNPRLAQAHLEVGLLYDDKLGDPILAVYHYRRFLQLQPASDKRGLVEDYIERAKLSLAARLPQSPLADPGELTRLQTERAALMQENAMLRARVAELEQAARIQPAPTAPPLPAPAPVAAETRPAPIDSPRPRAHIVQKGDTLQSLALHYYGTRSAWERIYEANRHSLSSKDHLRIGQQLVIP